MKNLVSILAIALAGSVGLPADAQAAFGINDFDVTFTDVDGSPAAQAGSHPFAMTTSLQASSDGEETEGRLKALRVDLPPGLVAHTTASPSCAEEDFLDPVEGCSLATVVGTSSSSFLEPDHSETALVYKLAPPEGVLLRLGFRVADAANVVVDVELSPDPPYNPIVVAGEWPETVDVFATEVQLWGVPADPAHDAQRGGPINLPLVSFLTLPRSCEGPQATFYEAVSWEGDEDSGSVFTHDGTGNTLGFFGCQLLSFAPLLTVRPTTEEAQSPTSLDLSIDVHDEGLVSPDGIAESETRHVALALPAGMTANAAVLGGLAVCSEEDLEEENLGAVPGEGCPEASRVGTVEVESPLVEGSVVNGALYLATPFASLAEESFLAFYAVIKDPDLGIIVKQVVEVEPDPETGQLIVFVEDIPQLPISHFSLHLDESGGGPLISPTLCGSYQTRAEFNSWADDGTFVVTSTSEIVSGPDGGACPSIDPGEEPQDNPSVEPGTNGGSSKSAPLSSAAPGSLAGAPAASRRGRRCPKGKRRVRRYGKTRCVKQHHRKHPKRRQR